MTIAEIILLTVAQDITQRGHREGDNELNPGNVRKILKFSAKHDAIIADHIRNKKECFVKMRFMRLPESFASKTNKELVLIVFKEM